ncbi:protein kinase [Nonomuraea fuscirosea]|uniref:protein kinase n=1 Tax=Nonomuraea fuscirosea TaxID=1291556 RepID=UPI003417EEEC
MNDQTRRIGPYTLVRKLGEGGMGIVYLAQDPSFAPVALKVLRPELAGREDFRRRFTREAEAARQVARFCTAPMLDAGIEGETAYLVTEYVDGPDLTTMIETRRGLGDPRRQRLLDPAPARPAAHRPPGAPSPLAPGRPRRPSTTTTAPPACRWCCRSLSSGGRATSASAPS